MSDLNLGHLITTPQNRDAIHVAVAPVEAAETLYPGQHVGLVAGSSTFGGCVPPMVTGTIKVPHLGIIDPYLTTKVMKGDRCWMFLYPQTVTGLRHDWTHPAFSPTVTPPKTEKVPAAPQPKKPVPVESKRKPASVTPVIDILAVDAAETWLRSFAEGVAIDYDDLMEAAQAWLSSGHYYSEGCRLSGTVVPPEFWTHYETMTGTIVPHDRQESFFTCSG